MLSNRSICYQIGSDIGFINLLLNDPIGQILQPWYIIHIKCMYIHVWNVAMDTNACYYIGIERAAVKTLFLFIPSFSWYAVNFHLQYIHGIWYADCIHMYMYCTAGYFRQGKHCVQFVTLAKHRKCKCKINLPIHCLPQAYMPIEASCRCINVVTPKTILLNHPSGKSTAVHDCRKFTLLKHSYCMCVFANVTLLHDKNLETPSNIQSNTTQFNDT